MLTAVSVAIDRQQDGSLVWDEFVQGLILSSFYWGYIVTQLPGGRLAEVFGPKHVLSVSLLGTALVTVFVPVATRSHYALVIVLRIVMGLLEVNNDDSQIRLPNAYIVPTQHGHMSLGLFAVLFCPIKHAYRARLIRRSPSFWQGGLRFRNGVG